MRWSKRDQADSEQPRRLLGKEKINQADHDDALGRIQTATDIGAMSECDLVVDRKRKHGPQVGDLPASERDRPDHTILIQHLIAFSPASAGSGRPIGCRILLQSGTANGSGGSDSGSGFRTELRCDRRWHVIGKTPVSVKRSWRVECWCR